MPLRRPRRLPEVKQGRTYRKLRLQCSETRAKASPSELRARLVVSRNRAKQEQIKSASGGPPGAFATWQAAGEKHPQPPARSVGVVPGRQGQAAARSRQAASLDPHPSDSAPQAPARASGAFSVKGGSRGWCGPQPPQGGTAPPLDATGATQACRQGVGGALPRHPCPSAKAPAGSAGRRLARSVRCRGHPLPGFQGRAAPWA